MSAEVLCAGIIVADFICDPIDHLPAAGELVMTSGISWAIGGCASNVAADLARLGRRVSVVGRTGDDAAGDFVCNALARSGVDTTLLTRTPGQQTSSTLVVNVRGEDRRFVHAFGANACFTGDEIPAPFPSGARVLYLGGFFLMPALTADRVAKLFQDARAAGLMTVLDVVIPDANGTWPALQKVLPFVDVFLPNTDEAQMVLGDTDPLVQASRFCSAGAKTVVITCGARGALLQTGTTRWRSGVFPVEFIDGTGSGDAFAAGYISGLLDGEQPLVCLARGTALGASCVRHPGATTGVFNRQQLDDFLSAHPFSIEQISG